MDSNNIPPPPPHDIPIVKPIGQGIDALFNSIVHGFDRIMTRMVNEGGLADMIDAVGSKVGDLASTVAQKAEHFSPFPDKSSSPDIPLKQQEIAAEVTPLISHDVAAQVASAGINIPATNMIDHSDAHNPSPSATPAQALTSNIGISV